MRQIVAIVAACLLGFGCGSKPNSGNLNHAETKPEKPKRVIHQKVEITEQEVEQLLENHRASERTTREERIIPPETVIEETVTEENAFENESPEPVSVVLTMDDVESEVFNMIMASEGANGTSFTEDQAIQLTDSYMNVIGAIEDGNAFKVAREMNHFARQASNMQNSFALAVGVVDILEAAADIVGLLPDLIAAVLDVDVAGIIAVAIDVVEIVLDLVV